jgi:prepilin-type N-terminal cleavage/methylation domain-containing protein
MSIRTSPPDRGFTLIEMLVALAVAGLLLVAFSTFYLVQQRAMLHHQVEIESSETLRAALEQMTRDIRSARKDLTYDFRTATGGSGATFVTAGASTIEFTLDADDDGTITTTSALEHKGFRRNTSTDQIEQYDPSGAGSWVPLADNVSDLTLAYWGCPATSGGALVALSVPVSGANLKKIVQVDVSVTVNRPATAGQPITRTEVESVRLRNVRCS